MTKALRQPTFRPGQWNELSDFAREIVKRVNALWETDDIADAAITPSKSAALPAAQISRNAAQAIPNGIGTLVQLDTQEFVTGAGTDTPDVDLQNGRCVIVRRAGRYRLTGQIGYQPVGAVAAGAFVTVSLVVNGGYVSSVYGAAATNVPTGLCATRTVLLNVGDVVDLRTFQNTGNPQNVAVTGDTKPILSVDYEGAI